MRALRSLCLLWSVPALASAQSTTIAQQAKTTPGHWAVTAVKPSNAKLAPMLDHMTSIMSVVRRDPAVDHPAGFTVIARVSAEQSSAKTMVNGLLRTFFIPHLAKPDGTIDTSGDGEGKGFSIVVNNVSCARGEKTDYKDAEGEFYSAITPTTFRGLREYGDNACILVTNRTAPITIPVSRERLGRALVAQFREEPEVVSAIQHELSAMTPAQRTAPAILDIGALTSLQMHAPHEHPLFADGESTTTVRVVTANPQFYDHTRPSDVQAIVVNFECGGRHDSPWCAGFPGVFEHVRDTMDWTGLARLLK